MKIAALADQHGNVGIHSPEADLLLLCGDHFPYYSTPTHWYPEQEKFWCETKWAPWLRRTMENIETKRGFLCPGNHDIAAYTDREWFIGFLSQFNITLLDKPNTTIYVEGLSISAYPYTHGTLKWAFNRPLDGTDDEIPEDIDILMSHAPPLGLLDTNERGQHVGSPILARQILANGPRVTLCGHIHEHRGRRTTYKCIKGIERKIINVSGQGRDGDNKGAKMTTFTIDP